MDAPMQPGKSTYLKGLRSDKRLPPLARRNHIV
jgi:hypothetical protein